MKWISAVNLSSPIGGKPLPLRRPPQNYLPTRWVDGADVLMFVVLTSLSADVKRRRVDDCFDVLRRRLYVLTGSVDMYSRCYSLVC